MVHLKLCEKIDEIINIAKGELCNGFVYDGELHLYFNSDGRVQDYFIELEDFHNGICIFSCLCASVFKKYGYDAGVKIQKESVEGKMEPIGEIEGAEMILKNDYLFAVVDVD